MSFEAQVCAPAASAPVGSDRDGTGVDQAQNFAGAGSPSPVGRLEALQFSASTHGAALPDISRGCVWSCPGE